MNVILALSSITRSAAKSGFVFGAHGFWRLVLDPWVLCAGVSRKLFVALAFEVLLHLV